LAQPACLVKVLVLALQSGAKQIFYCTVYYLTLNSNHEAQRAPKNLKKMEKIQSEAEIMYE
jgi:hypothetical protein